MQAVKHQPLVDIQIAPLCHDANVSRMFYYRHFSSKEQILNDKFKRQYQQYLRLVQKYQIQDQVAMATLFFTFFRDSHDMIQQLIDADLSYLVYYNFRDYFKEMLANQVVKGDWQYPDYWATFAAGGLSELLFNWIQNGTPESPVLMAKILFSFINPSQH